MNRRYINLDYAAATPLDKRVLAVMQPYFSDQFYNPSAAYQPARDVRRAIDTARAEVGHLLGARPAEIIFTAGATESINIAFQGVLGSSDHVVISATEHQAVRETAKQFDHTLLGVDQTGRLLSDQLYSAIKDTTRLISIGLINNETGTIQSLGPVAEVIKKVRQERLLSGDKTPLYLHSDASQAVGLLDLNVARLGVDLLTLGSNKFYGPKQTGILFVDSSISLQPLISGGGQERNLRSGTENVPNIIGLSEAFKLASSARKATVAHFEMLRHGFLEELQIAFEDMVIIGNTRHQAAHILSVAWPGLDAERALFKLESEGILVATGSACAANKATRSTVLEALGLPPDIIDGSVRFSFGRDTTQAELSQAAKIVIAVIKRERAR